MAKLTALGVKNAKPGRHGDGAGLYLLVKPSGAKSWLLRIQRDGKRRDIGLGSLAALSLADAREKSAELRKHALNGRDPIAERDRDNHPVPTFREATNDTHAALKSGWVEKNAAAFLTSLETYAHPILGRRKVDTIEASDILGVLAPIWSTKPELARKVRMRIGQVLNYSYSKGWRSAEAPGRAVSIGLPRQPKGGNFARHGLSGCSSICRRSACQCANQWEARITILDSHSGAAGRSSLCSLGANRLGQGRLEQTG